MGKLDKKERIINSLLFLKQKGQVQNNKKKELRLYVSYL